MKEKKLANKIAKFISVFVIVIFLIFILTAVIIAKNAIEKATYGELESVTRESGAEVQKVLNIAISSTKSMSSYMQKIITGVERSGSSIDDESDKNKSEIFTDLILSEENKAVERFLLATAENTVLNNDDIAGIGVLFEPYAFSKKKESYSFYTVPDSNGSVSITDFGNYEDYSNEDFYTETIKNMRMTITEPYMDKTTGIQMITVLSPIIVDNKAQGVISADIASETFNKIAVENENFKTIYNIIINEDNILIYHSTNPEKIGSDNAVTFLDAKNAQKAAELTSKQNQFKIRCKNADGDEVYKFYAPIIAGEDVWWANCTLNVSDVMKTSVSISIILIIISIISIIILILAIIKILQKQINPIHEIVKAANCIAQGNFDITMDNRGNNDEIGVLSVTFNETAEYLKKIISEISTILDNIAKNNLNIDTSETYLGEFKLIEFSITSIINNLNEVIANIGEVSNQVADGSEQMAASAQAIAMGAAEQAGVIEEFSATLNAIEDQVKQNTDYAVQASSKALSVGADIENSNLMMKDMDAAMNQINMASSQIANIIKTIEDIAGQTNLLSLNAAIEAARAGEAGKGFAVVADEVRVLADESARAAKDTVTLIKESLAAVENGTKIADNMAASLLKIVDGAKEVSKTVDEISNASKVQLESIGEVTKGVNQISAVIQTNSAAAQQSAASSEELSGQAQVLKQLIEVFELKK